MFVHAAGAWAAISTRIGFVELRSKAVSVSGKKG
jgi:hypothetical protein